MATHPISPWLERLQRRFSPRRVHLGTDGAQALPGGEGRTLVCVVGRELCLYLQTDASRAPAKQRAAFVAMAVRRAAPFADPDFGVAWSGDVASVWYWSRRRILDLLGSEARGRTRFVPDALYVGTPLAETGAQWLALRSGHEGRAWKAGQLIASRWWPAPPGPQAWAGFLRGAGLPGADQLPEPIDAPVAARPWSVQRSARVTPSLSEVEAYLPRLLQATVLVAALVLAFELAAMAKAGFAIYQARSAATSLDEPLKRILAARESVDQDSARIAELLALRPARSQLELLAEVARLMPGKQWQLRLWEQPEPERIEATVVMANPDLEALVASWEASPLFDSVSTELSGRPDEITIQARVVAREWGGDAPQP